MTEEKKSDKVERLNAILTQLDEDFALKKRLEDEFGLYVADEEKCEDLRKSAQALSSLIRDCVSSRPDRPAQKKARPQSA